MYFLVVVVVMYAKLIRQHLIYNHVINYVLYPVYMISIVLNVKPLSRTYLDVVMRLSNHT